MKNINYSQFNLGGLSLFALLLTMNGCGVSSTQVAATASATPTGLSISPNSQTVSMNSSLQFSASGGSSPYTYSVLSGNGSIGSTTGLYQSASTAGTVVIQVADASSTKASATITVGNTISVTTSPTTITSNMTVTLTPSGGIAPYTFKLSSGAGTLISNTNSLSATYLTPSVGETAQILVTDSSGNTTTAALTEAGSSSTFVGFFNYPVPNKVITGTVTLSASVYDAFGTTTAPSKIQFLLSNSAGSMIALNTVGFGGFASTTSFLTSSVPSGSYTLHLYAYDSNNVQYADIATPVPVSIQNLAADFAPLCTAVNGTAALASGIAVCQVPASSCPAGMVAYGDGNWTTTSSVTCQGGYSTSGCLSGQATSAPSAFHSTFEDIAPESTWAPQRAACGGANSGRNVTCYSTVTSIGCVAQ